MKEKLLSVIVGLAVIAGGVAIYRINHPVPSRATQNQNPTSVTPNPLTTAIADITAGKATLYDVRTPAEYASGHAQNAINLDSTDVEAGKLPDVPKDTKIYLYCHSGRRAGIVSIILNRNGFSDVTNLGSFEGWLAAGGPKA